VKNILKYSIISGVLVTLISIMVYGTAQQMLRMEANYVLLQLAADAVNKLNSGFAPRAIALPGSIEISKSLYPFLIILDQNKRVLVTSATLDGQIPEIPAGTFDYVAKSGQDSVTWQPYPGVREALVIDKYSNGPLSGYVVAGGTLKLTEDTIDKLGKDIFIGWFVINAFAVASIVFLNVFKKK
jgi:hypothetical protein